MHGSRGCTKADVYMCMYVCWDGSLWWRRHCYVNDNKTMLLDQTAEGSFSRKAILLMLEVWSMKHKDVSQHHRNCFNYSNSTSCSPTMKTPYVRWKFIWADANEDLFDLTVRIDGRVLRSVHRLWWEMREKKFEFQISTLLHCQSCGYKAVLRVDIQWIWSVL